VTVGRGVFGPVLSAWLVILSAAGEAQSDPATLAGDAYRLMHYWYGTIWRDDFRNGVEITADLTCDGVPDEIYAWRDGVNPEGEYFHVALISRPAGPDSAGWERLPDVAAGLLPLRLNVGTDEQFALCENASAPYGSGYKVTAAPVPADVREKFGLPTSCAVRLRIDDGMCDAIHVGYDPAKGMFVLDRN
jgi:hypothetical protein